MDSCDIQDFEDEAIEDFLEKLKLADKYLDYFITNGLKTTSDCYGITEQQLKDIGITLPGHYRRILSKLPGCAIKKPPRSSKSQSEEPEDHKLVRQNSFDLLDSQDEDPSRSAPLKPPRSPVRCPSPLEINLIEFSEVHGEMSRSGSSGNLFEGSDDCDVYALPTSSTLSGAVDQFVKGIPKLELEQPEMLENHTGSYDAVVFGENTTPLPTPPPHLSGDYDEDNGFPTPPAGLNKAWSYGSTNDDTESTYDRLNITRKSVKSERENQASNEDLENYDTYSTAQEIQSNHRNSCVSFSPEKTYLSADSSPAISSPGLDVSPQKNTMNQFAAEVLLDAHIPSTYLDQPDRSENIELPNPKKSVERQSFPRYENVQFFKKRAETTEQVESIGLGHSKSFDAYDVTERKVAPADDVSASLEDIYDQIDELPKKRKPKLSTRTSSLGAQDSLPKASGSFLTSLQHLTRKTQLPVVVDAPRDPMQSDDGLSDGDPYSSYGDADELGVYQSIEELDRGNAGDKSATLGAALAVNKDGRKRGRFRKHGVKNSRPISAIVDFKKMMAFNKQDSLEGTNTRGHHVRAQSTSEAFSTQEGIKNHNPGNPLVPISPMSQKKTKKGWLLKHGWHEGRAPTRKRWVVFDGDELIYYESDTKQQAELSKGIIPINVILRVQVEDNDPKAFHISTKGGRKYIFAAENLEERNLWTSTLLAATVMHEKEDLAQQFKPGGSMYMPYKEGHIKMDGSRQKTYLATKGTQFAYYKSNNEFNFGQPVARLSMEVATVKDLERKRFQVIFPNKTFTFTADSEEEKRSWVEALKDAISESLSDYKVIKEVWTSEFNRRCADCGREDPDWASINLAIVVCKHCAGVHRELGVHNSKVRSLKMDVKIWNDTMKDLLLLIGNSVANSFWASRLNPSDAITDMADKKQRSWYITSKYIEMQYLEQHRYTGNQEMLNKSLINAVRQNNLRDAYTLVFSGADPNCDTGKEHAKTPHLLAKHLGYKVIAEFLLQNGATETVSPHGHVTDRSTSVQKKESFKNPRSKPAVTLRDCLFKYGGDFKSAGEDNKNPRTFGITRGLRSALQTGEFQKRMCVLENNCFKYYDPDRTTVLKDEVDCSELISIGICQPEVATKSNFQYCFEVGRKTGRTYLFCAERKEIFAKWISGLMQAIVPPHIQNAMKNEHEYDRVGKMSIKSQSWAKKTSEWSPTWVRLKGKKMFYYHCDSRTMESVDLRKLIQIGWDLTQDTSNPNQTGTQNNVQPIPVFMLVFREKTYFLRSETKSDTDSWFAAMRRADDKCGPSLEDQQLTNEGVPIVLEKCMTYVEQFGLSTRGIYRLSGTHSKTSSLLEEFNRNARETQMREGELNVSDVSNALKRWFKSLPGSLLTESLHEEWIRTSQIEQHDRKLEWYKHLIEKLPDINRSTLKHLLIHLNNVASHEKENDMSIHNLAIVFGPTLMEPNTSDGSTQIGETSFEISCIEDLIRYFDWLFDVTEVDRQKEKLMLEAKEKISMAKQQQNILTTLDYDMMVPIYISDKNNKCVNYKVNMNAGELVQKICSAEGGSPKTWGIFEVIAEGDAERPLHHSEHVLSVIKSWEMPSTNYLVAKHDYVRDKLRWFKPLPAGQDLLTDGALKIYDGKKKWTKVQAELRIINDALTLHYVKTRPGTDINIENSNIYIGVDRKIAKSSQKVVGFTLNHHVDTKYFIAETETVLNRWLGHMLMHRHSDGYQPPASSNTASPETNQRRHSDMSAVTRPLPKSQQELGEAVRAVALQRISSTESDEQRAEATYEAAMPPNSPNEPASDLVFTRPQSFNPTSSLERGLHLSRPNSVTSPADPQKFRRRLATYHDGLRLYGDRCVAVLLRQLKSPRGSPTTMSPKKSPSIISLPGLNFSPRKKSPQKPARSHKNFVAKSSPINMEKVTKVPPSGSPYRSPLRRLKRTSSLRAKSSKSKDSDSSSTHDSKQLLTDPASLVDLLLTPDQFRRARVYSNAE